MTFDTIPVVVIVCCFKNEHEFCDTSAARLRAAVQFSSCLKKDATYILAGDVPYRQGGRTLEELAEFYLFNQGIPPEHIMRGGGYDTFSQARTITKKIRARWSNTRHFFLFTSDWYFQHCAHIWGMRAKENGLTLTQIPVTGTGGIITKCAYIAANNIVRIFSRLGYEAQLETFIRLRTVERKKGFTKKACR